MVMVVMAIIIIVLTGAMIIINAIVIYAIDVRIISNALKLLLIHYNYH